MSDTLYYRSGEIPASLPFEALTLDGELRTDLANHPDSVEACGFTRAPPKPDDTEAQTVEWDGEAEAWRMADRPPAPPPAPPPVPAVVSMRQARLALLFAGHLTRAEEILAAMPGEEGQAARIEWEYATELRRDHRLVRELGARLGLDDTAKDDLFRAAGQIA